LGQGGIEGAVSSKEGGAHKAKSSRRHNPPGKKGERERAQKQKSRKGEKKQQDRERNSNIIGDGNALQAYAQIDARCA
jgi:hypothetical protein